MRDTETAMTQPSQRSLFVGKPGYSRQSAERAERLLQRELRAAKRDRERLVREQTLLVREQRQALRRTAMPSPVVRVASVPPPASFRPVTQRRLPRSRQRRHEPHGRTAHSPVIAQHIHLCPPGQKLIAATCLPGGSVIVGQVPIQVEIVNQPRRNSYIREFMDRVNARRAVPTTRGPISGWENTQCITRAGGL